MKKLFGVVLLACALVGCSSSPWKVVRQGSEQPLPDGARFSIVPLDTAALEKPEQKESLGEWGGSSSALWTTSVTESAALGGIRIAVAGDTGDIILRAKVTEIEPGFVGTVYSRPSKLLLSVNLERPDGSVIDLVEIESSTDSTESMKSAGERLARNLKMTSKYLVEYLTHRSR